MKRIDWNPEKDKWLQATRGVGFESILYHIDTGDLLEVRGHNNSAKYPNQKLFVVKVDEYVYIVPFIESDDAVFLKTIIPSRRETRRYLKGNPK